MQPSAKTAFLFIWLTVFIEMLGIGIIIPVMPKLLNELTGLGPAEAARWGGFLMFVFAAVQFVMSPVLGNLSDRFGRRPVFLISLGGYSIDYAIMAFAPTLWILFIGRAVSGGFAATYATASAAISDISEPNEKAARFGMLGAAFGLGFIVGPAIGGALGELDSAMGISGARLSFLAASALAAVNMVFAYFFLPETLPKDERRPFELRRANPVGSLFQMRRYPIAIALLSGFFLMQVGHAALPATWTYYAEHRYGWTPFINGLALAFVGVVFAAFQAGLTGRAVRRFGEIRAMYVGLAAITISFVGYGLANPGWMILPFIVVGGAGGFVMPAIQSLLSSTLPRDAQGELQGAIASTMAITMIIGPLSMTQIFTHFSADSAPVYIPGAAFFTAAVLTVAAALAMAPRLKKIRMNEQAAISS